MKALLIKEKWLNLILDGDSDGPKDWEIRGSATTVRGRILLAQSGTGMIVGEVDLVDCFEVGLNTLVKNQKRCKINPLEVKYEKPHVWVLKNPYRYKEPIPYIHPQGAVIWVNLSGFESQLPAPDFGFEPVENKFYYGQQLYVKKGSVKIGTGK